MKYTNLLALPPAILSLLLGTSYAAEPQWPHNLPKNAKYFPEDQDHVRRSMDIQARMKREKPIGVKKMSNDEGEMFFLDNWIFASDVQTSEKHAQPEGLANLTSQLDSPLRPHAEDPPIASLLRFRARSALLKRDFKCPEDTNSCSSIGAPNSCCRTGSTCITVEDTGIGSVGCCSNRQSCSGDISCDTDKGYTSCPNSPNGGCCLPGYSCQDVGCVVVGTSVTYVQPSTSRPSSSTSSTGVIVVPTTASSTSTTSTSRTCTFGFFTCPASLGGGCCQSGRECATGASCVDPVTSSTTEAPSAPVRPTGESTSTFETASSDDVCPTGFYVCSAYYPTGCCRVGRDCQTTGSCAPQAPKTIVNSNGVTIAAPSGAIVATEAAPQGGSCPSAWYSCPANRGGNCCPEGYSCGEQCTATSGTGIEGKVAPSAATIPSIFSVWVIFSGGIAIGVTMLIL